ncbi:toxin-antitoxin system HicB family antitoxin [Micromonospora cathayae]|uniref:Toxin-antitoxin system HicB family antitoxin n=1 Tax=Micromonospora cathayae TaxID=3028804 RepID=A0ABY7ZR34_9ACTN|nr:toxin-antitoxin system HicB family antitoxin [Micromonospora sp. HUAS 3]WDZ84419.1 toxin-antitoxin system HicB family antitoxin [Micromonospora sp. HUAS 3]
MNLTSYVQQLRDDLLSAAELGGDETRALAERLTGPLESAFRLALLDALAVAAEEISRELTPGAVELRLRGREPEFVVTPPATAPLPPDGPSVPPPDAEEGSTARINFRLPEQLKSRIEQAAGREGVSVNAWLVRTTTAAVGGTTRPESRRAAPPGGQRYTGWAR